VLISVLVALAGNAIGLFVGSCFSNAKVATNIVPVNRILHFKIPNSIR